MSKKAPEFDFDDFDDMVELAKINPTMQDALSKLQDALSQAQTVYELTKPADPTLPSDSTASAKAGFRAAMAAKWATMAKDSYTKKRNNNQ